MTLTELQRKRQELIESLEKLEAHIEKEQKILEALSPEERLAVRLHESKCTWNHTDGCGWYYEIEKGVHDWNGSSHGTYLQKARKLIGTCCGDLGKAQDALDAFIMVNSL